MDELDLDLDREEGQDDAGEDIVLGTVTAVTASGVQIQVDGNDAAGQKEYKANSSVLFLPGDRVKLEKNSGTYIVEYVIGAPMGRYPFPAGGASGQYLRKSSNANYAVEWVSLPNDLPSGGNSGQVLAKASDNNYDVTWRSCGVPTGGAAGQVLSKLTAQNYELEWVDMPSGVPAGGASGQFLKKTSAANYAVEWGDAPHELPTGGTSGQVLTKNSANNYDVKWAAVPAQSVSKLVNGNYALNLGSNGVLAANNTTYNISLGSSTIPINGCYLSGAIRIGTAATASNTLGFFGHAPAQRKTVSDSATVATLITALKGYGLIA